MGVIVIFNAHARSTTSLAFLGLALSSSLFAANPTVECINWLVNGEVLTAVQIAAQNAGVQADRNYPLPYVLNNLGLNAWIPEAWNKAAKITSKPRLVSLGGMSEAGALAEIRRTDFPSGAPMISLGEGRGALIPLAVNKGLKAYGIDPANDPQNATSDKYLAKNWMSSLPDDARDLKSFADQSQKLVVSHDLLTQLNRSDRMAVLRESYRVLEVTGTARHSIVIPDVRTVLGEARGDVKKREDMLVAAVQGLVKEALGDQAYQFAVIIDEPQFRIRNSNATPITDLIDTDVTGPVNYSQLRAQTALLDAPALNVLIVLRRPNSSWLTFEGLFGI